MTIRCSQGHENPDGATFCDECGEPLPAAAPASAGDEAPTLQANPLPDELPVTMPEPDDALAPPPLPPAPEASQPAPAAAEDEASQAASAPPVEEAEAPAAMPAVPEAAPSAPDLAPIVPPSPPQPAPVPVASLPRLLVAGTTTTFDLVGKANVVLGREDAPSNSFPDIDLTPFGAEEGGVSRLHARLIQSGDIWTIEDLESTNSTFVNHKRIAPKTPTPLNDGDEIRLGRVDLRFKTTA